MHGKQPRYCLSSKRLQLMEDEIRRLLHAKLDEEEEVENHVFTLMGIFRLDRQNLIEEVKGYQSSQTDIKRFLDGQPSLEELQKYVLAFDLVKLLGLDPGEKVHDTVDVLFTKCDIFPEEEQHTDNHSENEPLCDPTAGNQLVSRAEQEKSYTAAFPALPKGTKFPPEPVSSIWQQRSPLGANLSGQIAKTNKVENTFEKLPSVSSKKCRTGGKENDQSNQKILSKNSPRYKNVSGKKKENLSSSGQSPKTLEYNQYSVEATNAVKQCLGLDDKLSRQVPAHEKKALNQISRSEAVSQVSVYEIVSETLRLDAVSGERLDAGFRMAFSEQEPAVWSPGNITENCWWQLPTDRWPEDAVLRLWKEQLHLDALLLSVGLSPADRRILCTRSDRMNYSFLARHDSCAFDHLSPETPESQDKHVRDQFRSVFHDCSSSDLDLSALLDNISSKRSDSVDKGNPLRTIWSHDYVSDHKWPSSHHNLALEHSPKMVTSNLQSEEKEAESDLMQEQFVLWSGTAEPVSMIERAVDQIVRSGTAEPVSVIERTVDQIMSGTAESMIERVVGEIFGNRRLNETRCSNSSDCLDQNALPASPLEQQPTHAFKSQLVHSSHYTCSNFAERQQDDDLLGLRNLKIEFKDPYDHSPVMSEDTCGCERACDCLPMHYGLKPVKLPGASSSCQLALLNAMNSSEFEDPDSHLPGSYIPQASQSENTCDCKGACNCLAMHECKRACNSLAMQNESGRLDSPSCSTALPNTTKSFSDSQLVRIPSRDSAFRCVSYRSCPNLTNMTAVPCNGVNSHSSHETFSACLAENASEDQTEKMKSFLVEVINLESPPLVEVKKPVSSSPPDQSIHECKDSFGVWTVKSDKPPDYLIKTSQGTQTSADDVGTSLSPTPLARLQAKTKSHEEKPWKELMPLSEEDFRRDLIAAMRKQNQEVLQPDFLDVTAVEGYDNEFADFQLLSEASASLHVPQSRAVYVKDLEKAWLSESHRRLGRNRVRRPMHPNKPCTFYLEGCCYRLDCKFSHDLKSITCHFWELGQCFKGDLCPFLHGYFRGHSGGSDGGEEFDVNREDFPELSRKEVRLNSAPAPKKRRNKKNSVHRLQLPRGT